MTSVDDVLANTKSVVIIDWPSKDVPETLARAGWAVFVKGGPQPDNYNVYELVAGDVVPRPTSQAPEHADLVYSHRPLSELPGVVELAQAFGARAVWVQSGRSEAGDKDPEGCWLPEAESRQSQTLVESAGLVYIEAPYIAGAVRGLD